MLVARTAGALDHGALGLVITLALALALALAVAVATTVALAILGKGVPAPALRLGHYLVITKSLPGGSRTGLLAGVRP